MYPQRILKLYVLIQDKVLLIPVERSRTCLNPCFLASSDVDGAVLNEEDEVTLIFQDGDKLVGQMGSPTIARKI